MNRRELISSAAAGLVGIPVASSNIVMKDDSAVIVLTLKDKVPVSGMEQLRRQLDIEEERTGCKFVLVGGPVDATVAGGKYAYSESIGCYSQSMHCQTQEEWKWWIAKNSKSPS